MELVDEPAKGTMLHKNAVKLRQNKSTVFHAKNNRNDIILTIDVHKISKFVNPLTCIRTKWMAPCNVNNLRQHISSCKYTNCKRQSEKENASIDNFFRIQMLTMSQKSEREDIGWAKTGRGRAKTRLIRQRDSRVSVRPLFRALQILLVQDYTF